MGDHGSIAENPQRATKRNAARRPAPLCWPGGARGGRAPSLLELYWREITQRRVQPAVVVYLVDEAKVRIFTGELFKKRSLAVQSS